MAESWEHTRLDHRSRKVASIAGSALSLLAQHGGSDLTMAAIAENTAISRQTLYRSRPQRKSGRQGLWLMARQVGVDRERNTVVVWVTFANRSDLYDYLDTDQSKDDHGEADDMADIIETFEMYDLTTVSGRLLPAR